MLGIHQSLPKILASIPIEAKFLGTDTFQVFIRNNVNLKKRAISIDEINKFNVALLQCGISSFVVHASYAMNPCDPNQFNRCFETMSADLNFLRYTAGQNYYVVHPGSSKDLHVLDAIDNLHKLLQKLVPYIGNTSIALEFMSGAGTQIFSNPMEVKAVIDTFSDIPNLKICFDTCHVFSAGYDIVECYDYLKDYIGVVHLNNSYALQGTHVDRHANIESGYIPSDKLLEVCKLSLNCNPSSPIILETPNSNILSDLEFLTKNL